MPFDVNDSRLQNFISEQEDINLEDVREVERNRKNYISFTEKTSKFTFIGISVREKRFDKEQLEKIIDTEITELS